MADDEAAEQKRLEEWCREHPKSILAQTLNLCEDGHTPDWVTSTIEATGHSLRIEVRCERCGHFGRVDVSRLEELIDW